MSDILKNFASRFTRQIGAIIGIVIGGTFLLLLIVLLLFLACRRRSNDSYSSPIFAVSRNASWHSPLEADDDDHYLAPYGPSPHDDGRFFGDHLSVEENGSAESAGTNGGPLMTAFGGHPPLPPLAQILHNSRRPSISPNYPSDRGNLRPWWANTEPLNVNKRVDPHVSARSTGSGGDSSRDFGSSGETPLLGGKTRRYPITEPRPVHKPSGSKNYPATPTGFALGRDSSLEYATQRIQEHQENERQQDRADQSISQIILARVRRQSTTTVKSSQSTTIRSEESDLSRARSHIYSPSLLNPPMIIPEFYQGLTGSTPDNVINQHSHLHKGGGESEKLFSPGATLRPAPPLLSTDASSMVEGLLHPRLGMALAHSQRASSMSLRDHEDYTRPINGVCFFGCYFFLETNLPFLYSLSTIIFRARLLLIPWSWVKEGHNMFLNSICVFAVLLFCCFVATIDMIFSLDEFAIE